MTPYYLYRYDPSLGKKDAERIGGPYKTKKQAEAGITSRP